MSIGDDEMNPTVFAKVNSSSIFTFNTDYLINFPSLLNNEKHHIVYKNIYSIHHHYYELYVQ